MDGQLEGEGSLGILIEDTVWQFETPPNSGIKVSYRSLFFFKTYCSKALVVSIYEAMLIRLSGLLRLYVLFADSESERGKVG